MGDCSDCNVLNRHMHPEPVDNCHDRCCMCCGYCTPIGVAILIIGLVIASTVYYILVMKDFPDAWRIVVCIIFILITFALGAAVLWSYYQIIFTAPGYVQPDPWKYPPVYMSPDSENDEAAERGGGGVKANGSYQASSLQRPPAAPGGYPAEEDNDAKLGGSSNPLLADEATALPYSTPSQDVEVLVTDRPREAAVVADGSTGAGSGPRRRTHSPFDSNPNQGPSLKGTPVGVNPGGGSSEQHQQQQPQQQGEGQRNPYIVTQLDRNGRIRYCRYCKQYKPDRSYHCHSCKHCIYVGDHHCPFVANCVGRNNYRLFVLFLLYATIGCTVACIPMVIAIFAIDKNDLMTKIGWIAVPGVMLILGLSLGAFYIEHRCLMAKGESTLESTIKQRKREEAFHARGYNPFSQKRKDYDAAEKQRKARKANMTEEEKAREEAKKKEKVEAHRRELWGTQTGWRAYLPYPIRTDNSPDGIPHI